MAETASQVGSPLALATFDDLLALVTEKREIRLKNALETAVRPIRFEFGRIEFALTDQALPELAGDLSKKLEAWTGTRWMIAVARDGGEATVAEKRKSAREKMVDDARANPLVSAVFSQFPGAEIVDIRITGAAEPALDIADDMPLPELPNEDD